MYVILTWKNRGKFRLYERDMLLYQTMAQFEVNPNFEPQASCKYYRPLIPIYSFTSNFLSLVSSFVKSRN